MFRFKNILCPVDFFPASLKALEYALKLARNYGATVRVLHVVVPVIPAAYGGAGSASGDLTVRLLKDSRRELRLLAEKAADSGVVVETDARAGEIDFEIRREIAEQGVDLVVMGTHGRRGFERWFMGSVAERLMRHCPVPLLTMAAVKKGGIAPPSLRRILVTTDFSAGTPDALGYAFSLAQECQAVVTLLHVVDDLADMESRVREAVIEGVREKLEAMIPDDVRNWCDVRTRVETGMPYQAIIEVLRAEKAQLLVMNVHGKRMIDRALVGSTAERMVRSAGCPLLLIPPAKSSRRRALKKKG